MQQKLERSESKDRLSPSASEWMTMRNEIVELKKRADRAETFDGIISLCVVLPIVGWLVFRLLREALGV